MAAEEAEEPGVVGDRRLADLGDLQRDRAFRRPHPAGFVAVAVPPMRLGPAVADVAVPAKDVRDLLLE